MGGIGGKGIPIGGIPGIGGPGAIPGTPGGIPGLKGGLNPPVVMRSIML